MSRVETKRKINNVKIHVKLHDKGETVLSTTRKGKNQSFESFTGVARTHMGLWIRTCYL
jgi:hypothetical protein